MLILLDSNVIISGLMSYDTPPARLLRSWVRDEIFELVTSEAQIAELARALGYDRVRARVREEQARNVLENMSAYAVIATALPTLDVSPDPHDNVILATAVAGGADLIVSGDRAGMLDLDQVSRS